MLMTHNYIDQSGATAYAAPEIEIYEMPAEGGFGPSNGGLDNISGDDVQDETNSWDF